MVMHIGRRLIITDERCGEIIYSEHVIIGGLGYFLQDIKLIESIGILETDSGTQCKVLFQDFFIQICLSDFCGAALS